MGNIATLQEGSQKEATQACEGHKFANLLLWALQQTCQIKETFETAGYLQQAVCGLETLDGTLLELEGFLLTLLLKDVRPKSYEAILRELAHSSAASQDRLSARTKADLRVCLPQISQLKTLDDKSGQHHIRNEEPGE